MGIGCCEHFRKAGYSRFTFTNRTAEHARRLARQFDGTTCSMDELAKTIGVSDVVVACTGSSTPLITRAILEKIPTGTSAVAKRLFMDLGVPRDIEDSVGEMSGVELLDLDDIHQRLNSGLKDRATAIGPAEDIVDAAHPCRGVSPPSISPLLLAWPCKHRCPALPCN